MCPNVSQARFLLLSKRSEGFLFLQEKKYPRNVWLPLAQAEIVDTKAFKLLVATDNALCYLTYFLFDCLYLLILKYELYGQGAE